MMTKESNQLIQLKHMHMELAKDVVSDNEEIRCSNIIKQIKND